MAKQKSKDHDKLGGGALVGLIMLLILSCFALLAFADETINTRALLAAALLCGMIGLHYVLMNVFFKDIDPYPLVIVYLLVSIGMILQWRINPEIAERQLVWVGLGMAGMLLLMLLLRRPAFWRRAKWLLMALSLGSLAVVLLVGNVTGGAKNWINLGGFSFQPSEFVKVALIYIAAIELSEKRSIKQLLWPLITFAVGCVGLLMLCRDLGAAVLYALTTLTMFFVATGSLLWTGAGLGVGALGSVASYHMFDHVRIRVAAWRNPWASYETNGYQIAQGLMAIASGGLFGMGLNLGSPKIIPAYHTDYIFAVICEELGWIVGLVVIGLYILLILRGVAAAMQSRSSVNALIATGTITMIALQTFLIIGGVIKLIPLTGVTLPFVSYGGSSMMGSFFMLGMLEAVIIDNKREQRLDGVGVV